MARQLTETAVTQIKTLIKSNIGQALIDVRTYRADAKVSTEPPPTESYFIAPEEHGYECPAIFIIDGGTDFRQSSEKSNCINALMSIDVSVKVEDRDKYLLTTKAWRYQAALHKVLDLTRLASLDGTTTLFIRVKRIKPSGVYAYANAEKDSTASFFFEYTLNLEVEYIENF